jgi:hypothetical protein
MTARVALATCAAFPELPLDDPLLLEELRDRGVAAEPAVWDAPDVDWGGYDLVVIRATYDYVWDREKFLRWVDGLPRVLNPPEVVHWNTDKRYLAELPGSVPTRFVGPGEPFEPPDGEFVVKPAVSAGAQDSARYRGLGSVPGDGAAVERQRARDHVARLGAVGKTALVQPYLASVDDHGETALLYIGGRYSHAIRKGPLLKPGDSPSRRLFALEEISPRVAQDDELRAAERALASLPFSRTDLLYARVDLIRAADGEPQLIELELTEPTLFLSFSPDAAGRLADEVVARL